MRLLPDCPKVFISYRRDASADLAARIRVALEKRGIDVFQDYDDLHKGKWTQQLLDAIEKRTLIPVLSPKTLERCREGKTGPFRENDWVLKEISHAINHERPIIPVYEKDFDFKDIRTYLPEPIAESLGSLQAVEINQLEFFNASITRLCDYLEPRWWIRVLCHPWTRLLLIACQVAICLIAIGLAGYVGYQTYYPPPGDLEDPRNVLEAPGWQSDLIVRDVAAGDDNIWLATDQGLWVYRTAEFRFEAVPAVSDDLRVVSTNDAGTIVWFALTTPDPDAATLGFYDDENVMPLDDPPFADTVLSISLSDDGANIWFGTAANGLYRYHDGAWQTFLVRPADYTPDIPIPVAQIAVYENSDGFVFWTTSTASIYRGTDQPDAEWIRVNAATARHDPLDDIYDFELDEFGHLWIAHAQGISVLHEADNLWNVQTNQWMDCTPENSALLAAPVLNLSASHDGHYMWIVTASGVHVVETSQDIRNCKRLQWQTWDAADSSDPFWRSTIQEDRNIRIETAPQGIAWVYRWSRVHSTLPMFQFEED